MHGGVPSIDMTRGGTLFAERGGGALSVSPYGLYQSTGPVSDDGCLLVRARVLRVLFGAGPPRRSVRCSSSCTLDFGLILDHVPSISQRRIAPHTRVLGPTWCSCLSCADRSLQSEIGMTHPMRVFRAVFPPANSHLVPDAVGTLLKDPNSELSDLYPLEFDTDKNGFRHEWQGVALLPFVDQDRLISAFECVCLWGSPSHPTASLRLSPSPSPSLSPIPSSPSLPPSFTLPAPV